MLFGFPRVLDGIAERCVQAALALHASGIIVAEVTRRIKSCRDFFYRHF